MQCSRCLSQAQRINCAAIAQTSRPTQESSIATHGQQHCSHGTGMTPMNQKLWCQTTLLSWLEQRRPNVPQPGKTHKKEEGQIWLMVRTFLTPFWVAWLLCCYMLMGQFTTTLWPSIVGMAIRFRTFRDISAWLFFLELNVTTKNFEKGTRTVTRIL